MEMYNANGKGKPLHIKQSKEEVEGYVLKKYQRVDIHPKSSKRKG